MGRVLAALYDGYMRSVEEAGLGEWRAALLAGVGGEVLEVGSGTGANLPSYPAGVTRLVLAEPDRHMRRRLADRVAAAGRSDIEVCAAAAEQLPMAAGTFDWVVSTLVLCSVPDIDAALREIGRVLRPGGGLVFLEHVAASPDRPRRRRWQGRLEPLWKLVAGNCHLTRETEAALSRLGFCVEQIERESLRKAMPLVRPSIRGVARWHGAANRASAVGRR